MAKNRNLFRLTRFILLKIPALFKFFSNVRSPKKRVLIIKADAIGDYILFRNFIQAIKETEKYKDYRFDLLGNTVWKDIALHYDAGLVNQFYFIDPDALYDAPVQVIALGWQLYKCNYEVVLQPSFTRTLMESGLAGLTAAKDIIGFETNTERMQARYKLKTDRFYTRLLKLPTNIYFELERTSYFFQKVLNEPLAVNAPFIKGNAGNKNGIVIFPGAGVSKRSWEPSNFLELIKLIRKHSDQPVYLCGGPAEITIADYLTENLPAGSTINLTGKTSLPQLVNLIGSVSLLIANETSAIHIAAATKTSAVCILGGGHFGRFAPYPDYLENRPVCIYEQMECYHCNWNCKFDVPDDGRFPCISKVSVPSVWETVLPLLSVWVCLVFSISSP